MAAPDAAHNCPVCLEAYVPRRKPRIFVECGHDSCTQCIVDMAAHGRDRCPTCTHIVRMAGDLPVIWRLIGDGPASKEAEDIRPPPRPSRAWALIVADEAPWVRPFDFGMFVEAPHMALGFLLLAIAIIGVNMLGRAMHHLRHLIFLTPAILLLAIIICNLFVCAYNGGVVMVAILRGTIFQ